MENEGKFKSFFFFVMKYSRLEVCIHIALFSYKQFTDIPQYVD